MDYDLQTLMDGIIGEDYVKQHTGQEDLSTVVHLSLTIDTSRQSIYDLHYFLPNLQHLALDNSAITSIRDLGIGLRFIKSLSLSSCGLIDIDGIGVLTGLQDLCLSDNCITDVTPLAMHENLQNLNLSGNRIGDISVADSLSSCLALRSLFLSRNPICKARNYRLIIASILSGLQMLDGRPVDPDAAKKVNHGMILESAAELRVAEEDLDDEMRLENDILGGGAAASSIAAPAPAGGSGTNISGGNNSGGSGRSGELIPDTGSELTHGSSVVLAGNMAAAVRRRRQADTAATNSSNPGSCSGSTPTTDGIGSGAPVEYESTLDILDAALSRQEGGKSSASASFYKEGDVTAALRGSSTMHASLRLRTEDIEDHDDSDGDGDEGGGRGAGGLRGSASSPQVSGRSQRARSRNESGEFSSLRESAPSPAAGRGSGSQRSLSGRRADAADASMSFDGDSSFLRPRTSAGSVTGSGKHLNGLASPALPTASPRQRNSSRPQSAASVGSGTNSPQFGRSNNNSGASSSSTHAAPFKVSMEKRAFCSTEQDDTSNSTSPSPLEFPLLKGAAHGGRSIVHLDIVKRPTGSYMIADADVETEMDSPSRPAALPTAGEEDGDSDTEDIGVTHAARHRLMFASSSAGSANSATSNLKARQQILQRLKSTGAKADATTDASPDRRRNGSPGLARLPRAGGQGDTGAAAASTGSPRLEMGIAERGTARKGSRASFECEIESLENSPPRPSASAASSTAKAKAASGAPPKVTQSSKAGMSLGFNLAGSLAAIDKWVQDMNSEDEAGEGTEEDDRSDREGGGARRGSGLSSAGAATARWSELDGAHSSGLDGHSRDSVNSFTSDFSATSSSRGGHSKILSRDTILSMCSNSGRDASALQDQDADSDLDEQLSVRQLPDRRQRQVRSVAASAQEPEATTPGNSTTGPAAAAPTARARNADILNRVNGRSGSRTRGNGATSATNAAAEPDAAAETAPVAEAPAPERASRPRPRAVPDFAAAQLAAGAGRPSGAIAVENAAGETVSPPRHTASAGAAAAGPTYAVLQDHELVLMLRQKPKNTLNLRTTASFQQYFSGIARTRMLRLLELAYSETADEADRKEKVEKRMRLLDGFMV